MLSTRPDDTFFLNCRVCQRFIGSSGLCLWLVGLGTKCPFCLWCCNLTSSMAMALFQDWQDLWMAYKQSGLSPTAVIFLAMAGDSWGYRGPPVFAIRDGTSRKWPSLFMWPLAYVSSYDKGIVVIRDEIFCLYQNNHKVFLNSKTLLRFF